ncbi:hypothetical protein QQ020_23375 [Fulvivirgaceae bacterium BMA12]|uniref:Carboxypeptidase regulatory-like domain-containing protein n=1 Tax=Agaribacillus aureus TaxID=3051825 RepID=A0ABT8LDK4_9BACT|nr:hypothetical protein [Fulvivirgaceae bacterium BMA12]
MEFLKDIDWISELQSVYGIVLLIVLFLGATFYTLIKSGNLKGKISQRERARLLRTTIMGTFISFVVVISFLAYSQFLEYQKSESKKKHLDYIMGQVVDSEINPISGVEVFFEQMPDNRELTTSNGNFMISNKIKAVQGDVLHIRLKKNKQEYDEWVSVPIIELVKWEGYAE